jgi:hypothetical protein
MTARIRAANIVVHKVDLTTITHRDADGGGVHTADRDQGTQQQGQTRVFPRVDLTLKPPATYPGE